MTGSSSTNPDDLRISAYLDGTMLAGEVQDFEFELARNPALAEALLRWQANDRLMQQAFDAPMHETVDQDMLVRFGLDDAPAVSNVVDLSAERTKRQAALLSRKAWRWPAVGALAASIAALVVVTNPFQRDGSFDPDSSASFQTAMQDLPSGSVRRLEDGRTIGLTLSVSAGNGRYCREFSLSGATPQIGIACRSGSRWSVEALVNGAADRSATGEIQTAAGADHAALDPVYARLMASDPIDAGQEKRLISSRWNK
jgi:hypothetical protein